MMWKIFGLAVLLYVFHPALAETGCPEEEDILPCVCFKTPYIDLECQNLSDSEVLRNVFVKSERYTYNEVHIRYSIMQYLPCDIFEKTEIHQLYLKNVTLSNLFDKPPKAADKLRTLHIEDCRVGRGIFWRILEPMKNLKILTVYFNSIRQLGKDFSDYVPKELEQLSLFGTGTKTIKPGVFANFTKLDTVKIEACKITTLTRDIFPTPFNGRYIYFNDNKLKKLPADMFKKMPNLQKLSLRKNQIATLPKEAFDSSDSVSRIKYLSLIGNPLKCDCLLVWLMDVKPPLLQGTCASPKKLAGRELEDLVRTDFNC